MNNLRDSAGEDKPSDEKPGGARRSRFDHFNDFIDHGKERLRKLGCASAAMLWVTLWRFENADTGLVRVSARTLAQSDGTDDTKSVRRMLTQLEAHGFLEVVDPGRPGRGSCAVYRLHGEPIKGGTMPPIRDEDKGGMVPPISAEKGARRTVKGGMVPPVQKRSEKNNTEARAPKPPMGASCEEEIKTPEEGIGGDCQEAIAFWIDARKAKYGVQGKFSPQDAGRIRNILAALGGDVDRFKAAVDRYMSCANAYEVKAGHSLALFAKQYERWTIDAPASQPDVRYTAREQADMRMFAQIAEALARCPTQQDEPEAPSRNVLSINEATGALEPIRAKPPATCVPVPRVLATPEFCALWDAVVADPRNANVPRGDAQAKLEALAAIGTEKAIGRLRRAQAEERTLNRI